MEHENLPNTQFKYLQMVPFESPSPNTRLRCSPSGSHSSPNFGPELPRTTDGGRTASVPNAHLRTDESTESVPGTNIPDIDAHDTNCAMRFSHGNSLTPSNLKLPSQTAASAVLTTCPLQRGLPDLQVRRHQLFSPLDLLLQKLKGLGCSSNPGHQKSCSRPPTPSLV